MVYDVNTNMYAATINPVRDHSYLSVCWTAGNMTVPVQLNGDGGTRVYCGSSRSSLIVRANRCLLPHRSVWSGD